MKNQTSLFFAILGAILTTGLYTSCDSTTQNPESVVQEVRDVSWFLQRLRTVDHLPELENSHTAMVSTWDTTGNNMDALTHDQTIEGNSNTILNIDGPGCMHRIFTGFIDERFDSTRIQIYLDHSETPLFDMPITQFFDDRHSPFPYPLAFVKSYPGTLMPIPFNKNITVKVLNKHYGTNQWILGMWGVYWQFTYTTYEEDVHVRSLSWPLNDDEQEELDKTCQAWLEAESAPPAPPEQWTVQDRSVLEPGESMEINLKNSGIIQQMNIVAQPDIPEVLNSLRLQMFWDGCELPSVDIPLGYMFGHGATGHNHNDSSIAAVMGTWPNSDPKIFLQSQPQPYNTNYHSLLLGMTDEELYCMFPMPFSKGATVRLVNTGSQTAEHVEIRLDIKKMKEIPKDWGRFHITWSQAPGGTEATPKIGAQNIPVKVFLSRRGKGKYVGSMLQVEWDDLTWWGEGDWLFWTDEHDWPPSYHGTGTEEYFNSGWGMFDRKAVSGFVSLRPGYPTVYSFHLNDAFNFQENIAVVEEQWALVPNEIVPNQIIADLNPMWSSTAFWYSATPTGAESMQ
ncbi:MAG: glycoside hydrolase family 172 protein [Bacteroidota bacterium]